MSITKITQWHGSDEHGTLLELLGVIDRFHGLDKCAGAGQYTPVTQGFVEDRLPRMVKIGHVYVLDTALGAGEGWGPNVNADWFGERMLREKTATFMSHAMPFEHHRNKDPRGAKGVILYSAYNPGMRRTELVVEICRERGPMIASAIDRGEYPRTSMGFRAEADICSICGNVAKTRAQYCDHLKFEPNKTYEDGRKVYAINEEGHFFDHSYVLVPADRTAGTMMILKVASPTMAKEALYAENVLSADVAEACGMADVVLPGVSIFPKQAAPNRDDVVDLLVEKIFPAIDAHRPPIERTDLEKIADADLGPLALHGVVLRPEEFQYVILRGAGMRKLATMLESAGVSFDPNATGSQGGGQMTPMGSVSEKLAHILPTHSLMPQAILARFVGVIPHGSTDINATQYVHDYPEHFEARPKLASVLAGAYRDYIRSAGHRMSGIGKLFVRHGLSKLAQDPRSISEEASESLTHAVRAAARLPQGRRFGVRQMQKIASQQGVSALEEIRGLDLDIVQGIIVESALDAV